MVLLDTLFGDIPIPSYEHCSRMCRDGLESFMLNGVIVYVIILLILFVLVWAYHHFEILANKTLKGVFFVAWTLGFIVYDIGMYTGEPLSIVGNAPMAVLHAFEMFILHSETSAIHEPFHNNWVFMMFFSLAHVLAAYVSTVFVIKQFGYNLISVLRIFWHSISLFSKKDITYVFWGLSDASYYLAKSIKSYHENAKNNNYRIIVVRANNDSGQIGEHDGIRGLFNIFNIKNKDYYRLRELNCFITNAHSDLSLLQLQDENGQSTYDILIENLRLRSLRRIIRSKTQKELHIFSLSEDSRYNAQVISNLKKDETINTFSNDTEHIIRFYCSAHHNSVSGLLGFINPRAKMDVRIIDSSHLSIECLKREVPNCGMSDLPNYQPINFVDIDKTENYGTVSSVFSSLIVGFGNTGQNALRYLYEFGSFVDSSSTSSQTYRSKFRCHIVDKDMDSIKGPIMKLMPNVFSNKNHNEDSTLVELHSLDYNSDGFFNLLETLAKELNYIVIAVGDDDASITLAVQMFKFLRRKGRDFKKLRIFVRTYDAFKYSHIKEIADYYNGDIQRIVLFGQIEKIYSYGIVVRDEFEIKAKSFYDSYRTLNPELGNDDTWEERHRKVLDQLNGESSSKESRLKQIDNVQKLNRQEYQDKANALHGITKIHILEAVIPNWYEVLVPKLFKEIFQDNKTIIIVNRNHTFKNKVSSINYPLLNKEQSVLLDNLAKLEHIRWIASHEVLGYTTMPEQIPDKDRKCDEGTVTHNCLIPWEQLDNETDRVKSKYVKDYKLFDYGVVETTIDIKRKEESKKRMK